MKHPGSVNPIFQPNIFQQRSYSIIIYVHPYVRFWGKRDFLGPQLRYGFATYGCWHPCFIASTIDLKKEGKMYIYYPVQTIYRNWDKVLGLAQKQNKKTNMRLGKLLLYLILQFCPNSRTLSQFMYSVCKSYNQPCQYFVYFNT